jgi:hypothetical protein
VGGACDTHGRGEEILVGRPEGKRPLGRPRRRWEGEIRMDLRETGSESVEWMRLTQGRGRWRAVVSAVMNLRSSVRSKMLRCRHVIVLNFPNSSSVIHIKVH